MIFSLLLFSGANTHARVKDEDRNNAYIPVEKELKMSGPAGKNKNILKADNTSFPANYRSDEQDWAEGIRIKDQGRSGLCWAFSATTAAEYSYAKDTYAQQGRVSEMSPGHLGYFLFNRVNDPLGNTEGDGFTIDAGDDGWPSYGGNTFIAMAHMATYSGLGLESEAPFNLIKDNINSSYQWVPEDEKIYDDDLAYKDYATMRECAYIPLEGESGENLLKSMITEYGAACLSIEMNTSRYMNKTTFAFYNPNSSEYTDHSVTVIGWDDNYSKENFKTQPKGDGAWIVQNSWDSDWGDDGLFYVSYYSGEFTTDNDAFAFEMQPADRYTYNFQYDGSIDNADSTDTFIKGKTNPFETKKDTRAANVFVNTTGKVIELDAVSFNTFNYSTTPLTINVYTGLREGDDPDDGIAAGTTQCNIRNAGIKTIDLAEPVAIGPDEKFAIVFSFPVDTAFGIEKDRKSSAFDHIVETKPGQSYFSASNDGDWEDMDDYKGCWRIKGLANTTGSAPDDISFTVRFNNGYGGVISDQTVKAGESAIAPDDPVRDGYDFVGWDKTFDQITGNMIVSAKWKLAAPKNAPAIKATTDSSVTIDPTVKGQVYVIVKKGEDANWDDAQKSENGEAITFDDLDPNTEYTALTRVPGDDEYEPSPSKSTDFKTDKSTPAAPTEKPAAAAGVASITIDPSVEGQEYIVVAAGTDPANYDWTNARSGNGGALVFSSLEAGKNYQAVTRIKGGENNYPSAPLAGDAVRARKKDQSAPKNAPVIKEKTDANVTIDPTVKGQVYVIAKKGENANWDDAQKSENGEAITFDDLDPNTEYTALTRVPGDDEYEPSPSKSTDFKTDKSTPAAPTEKPAVTARATSVTIDPSVVGQEYIVVAAGTDPDNYDWRGARSGNGSALVFSNLETGNSYQAVTRIKGKENSYPSAPLAGNAVTTKKMDQNAPNNAPVVKEATDVSATIDPTVKGQVYVIVKKGEEPNWENAKKSWFGKAIRFGVLDSNTEYTVLTRIPGNSEYNPSPAKSTEFRTDKSTPAAPTKKPVTTAGIASVIVDPSVEGQEYIVVAAGTDPDNYDWTNARSGNGGALVFSPLETGKSYQAVTRIKGGENNYPSAPLAGDAITISKKTQPAAESLSGKTDNSGKRTTTAKHANTMTVKSKKAKIKYKKLKKKNVKFKRAKYLKVKNAKGTVRYKLLKVNKKKFKKYFKIKQKTGKLTIKKRLKKGVYKLKVAVTASGNSSYKSAAKNVTVKIRVR